MSSVFTKIIRDEIPCYKIYEDERTFAFWTFRQRQWDIRWWCRKKEVVKVYELQDEDYRAVMETVRKLMQHYETQFLGKG